MKEYNEALEYYDKALVIYNEQLGEHYRVATCLDSVGTCYSKKGKYETALTYFFKALDMRKKIFGEEHVYIADSYWAIGSFHTDKEDHKHAILYY